MTPYYSDDAVTIYHGDCRDVMPDLTYEVVVTDPPYGTDHYKTDQDVTDIVVALIGQPSAVFGWPELLVGWCITAGRTPTEWVTWWPTNGAIRGFNLHGLWRESEAIAVFGKFDWSVLRSSRSDNVGQHYDSATGRLDSHGDQLSRRMGDVWRHPAPGLGFNAQHRLHPNEKPVDVLVALLSAASSGLVLDPFMGSGTTLLAAKYLGRKAVGVELDERYCEIAASRMSQEVLDFGGAA